MPYYIGNTIQDRDKLLVQTPESFKARLNIDVRVLLEVIHINRDKKEIEIKNYKTRENYTGKYDKLIVSPGAEPVKPPISGINDESVFTRCNVKDTDIIKYYCNEKKP